MVPLEGLLKPSFLITCPLSLHAERADGVDLVKGDIGSKTLKSFLYFGDVIRNG